MTGLFSCASGKKDAQVITQEDVKIEEKAIFDADSAYSYLSNQVLFGPRVPNTKAHARCGEYLTSELKRHGAKVYLQEMNLTAFDGTKLKAKNIMGSYNPDAADRLLFLRIGILVPGQTTTRMSKIIISPILELMTVPVVSAYCLRYVGN